MAARTVHHESRQLRKKCFEGRAPFYFNFFCKRYLHDLLNSICVPCKKCFFLRRWATWSWYNIQRSDLVFCFLGCLWLSSRHARLAAGGEGRVRQLSVSFFLFLSFLSTVLAFFHDQTPTLTQARKVRRHAERPKGDREQFASLDFWITD